MWGCTGEGGTNVTCNQGRQLQALLLVKCEECSAQSECTGEGGTNVTCGAIQGGSFQRCCHMQEECRAQSECGGEGGTKVACGAISSQQRSVAQV